MAMALVLNARFPGRNVLRSVVLIPWAMSPVAVGILWGWIFDGTYGTLNALLFDLHLIDKSIPWLASGRWAFHIVALVHVWNQAPLTCLLILAGLQSLPENLTSAARIDGAGPWQRFLKITLPWLRPMLLLVMILTSDQLDHGLRSVLDHDQGRPGQRHHRLLLDGLRLRLPVLPFGEGAAILYVLTHHLPRPRLASTCGCSSATGGSTHRGRGRAARGLLGPRASRAAAPAAPAGPAAAAATCSPPAPAGRSAVSGSASPPLLIFVWSFGPFLWLVVMSLSPSADLVRTPPTLIPHALTFDNYRFVLFPTGVAGGQCSVQATRVPFSILNSLIVAACVTAINLVLGSLAGYAYARATAQPADERHALGADDHPHDAVSLALILPFFIIFRTLGPARHPHRRWSSPTAA